MDNYIIGIDNDVHLSMWGKKYILEKRDDDLIEKLFDDVSSELKKENINCERRKKALITLEVGYKEEDVEVFIGYEIYEYEIHHRLMDKKFDLKDKMIIEPFGFPTSDYLVAIEVNNNISYICKKLVEYAKLNELQIIGPFMEIYKKDTKNIYIRVEDLKREKVFELIDRRRLNKIYEEYKKDNSVFLEYFKNNKELIGKWKIREILPNIDFNPNIQKSIPDTKYDELIIYENGNTNYDNVKWTDGYLIIESNNNVVANSIDKFNINNKEYLEIRMNDMYDVYPNAKPISYIYEKD